MKDFRTKVDLLGVVKGSKVTFDDAKEKDNTGKTGKLLCTIPSGGSLFYSPNELDEITS